MELFYFRQQLVTEYHQNTLLGPTANNNGENTEYIFVSNLGLWISQWRVACEVHHGINLSPAIYFYFPGLYLSYKVKIFTLANIKICCIILSASAPS